MVGIEGIQVEQDATPPGEKTITESEVALRVWFAST